MKIRCIISLNRATLVDSPFPISKIKLSQLAQVGILNLPSLYGCGVCGGGALALETRAAESLQVAVHLC